jgi:cell division protein FtsB
MMYLEDGLENLLESTHKDSMKKTKTKTHMKQRRTKYIPIGIAILALLYMAFCAVSFVTGLSSDNERLLIQTKNLQNQLQQNDSDISELRKGIAELRDKLNEEKRIEADLRTQVSEKLEKEKAEQEEIARVSYNDGCLSKASGVCHEFGKVWTYYNLPMQAVDKTTWVSPSGAKRNAEGLVILASNNIYYPKGTVMQTPFGQGVVEDACAGCGADKIDIAVGW